MKDFHFFLRKNSRRASKLAVLMVSWSKARWFMKIKGISSIVLCSFHFLCAATLKRSVCRNNRLVHKGTLSLLCLWILALNDTICLDLLYRRKVCFHRTSAPISWNCAVMLWLTVWKIYLNCSWKSSILNSRWIIFRMSLNCVMMTGGQPWCFTGKPKIECLCLYKSRGLGRALLPFEPWYKLHLPSRKCWIYLLMEADFHLHIYRSALMLLISWLHAVPQTVPK